MCVFSHVCGHGCGAVDGCTVGGGVPGVVAVKLRCFKCPLWWKGWLVAAGSGVAMCLFSNVFVAVVMFLLFMKACVGHARDFNMLVGCTIGRLVLLSFGLRWAWVL